MAFTPFHPAVSRYPQSHPSISSSSFNQLAPRHHDIPEITRRVESHHHHHQRQNAPERDWSIVKAVPILLVVGPTPCKQQLDILFECRPVGVGGVTITGEKFNILSDIQVVPMNCAAFISHKTSEGGHVRATLHSIAQKKGIAHNCTIPVIRSRGGSLHLLETIVVYL